jgi:hypothetical protein
MLCIKHLVSELVHTPQLCEKTCNDLHNLNWTKDLTKLLELEVGGVINKQYKTLKELLTVFVQI